MKKLTLDQWEKKYIAGPIERFSEKDHCMERINWDLEFAKKAMEYGGIHAISGQAKDKPGFTLMDQAVRWGAWAGIQYEILDTSRPNTLNAALAVEKTIAESDFFNPYMMYQPPKDVKLDISNPDDITRRIKKAANYYGADLVGICKLDRRWLYSHTTAQASIVKMDMDGGPPDSANLPQPGDMNAGPPDPANLPIPPEMEFFPQDVPEEYQYAIVTAYEMDYTLLNYYQTYINVGAIGMGYSRVAITNNFLAACIRNLGYKAITSTINRVALHTPMAMLAGLGEVGRHGMLITPQFGPRVRIGIILTDLPLVPDAPIEFGVTEFCNVCMKCADMCPSKSISKGKRLPITTGNRSQIINTIKWEMNPESCQLHWFRGGKDCAMCLSICPYNKVNTWPHRSVRWFSDHARWLDSLFVKMDDLFGYGKIKNPSNFWNEWEPHPFGRSEK